MNRPAHIEKLATFRGHLFAQFSEDDESSEIHLDGDPEGLRSLASLLNALAELDQSESGDLPDGAREHVHLNPGIHLGTNSVRIILSRADERAGQLASHLASGALGAAKS